MAPKLRRCGLGLEARVRNKWGNKARWPADIFTVSCTIPSSLVASCWPLLPGVWSKSNLVEVLILMNRRYPRIEGRGILPGLQVYVWKVTDSTIDSAVAILFVAKYIKKNLEKMHRSCLEGGVVSFACLPATENISWSFAAPQKTVKTIRQRLWPNAGVTEGLAARGLFAARLWVYKTQHRKHIRSVGWMNPFRCERPASKSTSLVIKSCF